MPYYPLARLILTDSFNRVWIEQARTRFGIDSVTILRQGVQISGLQQAVVGANMLDSVRLGQLGMYRNGEAILTQRVANAEKGERKAKAWGKFWRVMAFLWATAAAVGFLR